jgi:hypothetical protein
MLNLIKFTVYVVLAVTFTLLVVGISFSASSLM